MVGAGRIIGHGADIPYGILSRTKGMILSILATIALLGAAGGGATYIRAGNVLDGEKFAGSRVIVVEDGRIAAVEDSGFAVPAGAEVIDATDATVMPGLIDGTATSWKRRDHTQTALRDMVRAGCRPRRCRLSPAAAGICC